MKCLYDYLQTGIHTDVNHLYSIDHTYMQRDTRKHV